MTHAKNLFDILRCFAMLYGINVFFGRLTKLEKIRLFKTLAKLFVLSCLTILIISTIVSVM